MQTHNTSVHNTQHQVFIRTLPQLLLSSCMTVNLEGIHFNFWATPLRNKSPRFRLAPLWFVWLFITLHLVHYVSNRHEWCFPKCMKNQSTYGNWLVVFQTETMPARFLCHWINLQNKIVHCYYKCRAVASGPACPALAGPIFAPKADYLKIKAEHLHTLPYLGGV